MKLLTKFFLTIDFLIICLLVIIYIPYIQKRMVNDIAIDKKINYLSYVFYSEEDVDRLTNDYDKPVVILDNSYGDTYVKMQDKMKYDNIYDQLILSRDPGNDDYKIIKTLIGGYPAYVVVIYHPEDVKLLKSKAYNTRDHYSGLSTVKEMTKASGAIIGINGGGFRSDSRTFGIDTPTGYIIKDGKIIWNGKNKGNLICMTNDDKLLLIKATGEEAIRDYNVRDALEFGPFLIVDGKSQKVGYYAGGFHRTSRTVIAQRKDGIMLFLVTDNNGKFHDGPNMSEIIKKLELYGVYNAANLDGGGSSQLVVKGKLYNHPVSIYNVPVNGGTGRSVVNGWGLIIGSGKKG